MIRVRIGLRRRIQGVIYFGVLIPLTFVGVAAMIGVDALRRLVVRRKPPTSIVAAP